MDNEVAKIAKLTVDWYDRVQDDLEKLRQTRREMHKKYPKLFEKGDK